MIIWEENTVHQRNESLRCWWIFRRLITAVILQCRNNTAIAKGRKRCCYFKRRTIRDCKRQYRLSDSSDDLGEGNLKQESENRELFAGKEKRIADACPHASIKNGHPHRMPKRKKVMKKKNDIYKLGCCLLLNNRRIF